MGSDGRTGLLGRDRELEALAKASAAARARDSQIVLVTGDTGLGKTRLLREFADREETAGALVLWGGSPPVVGPGLPLAPVSEMLRPAERRMPGLLDDWSYLRTATGIAPSATGAGGTATTAQAVVFEEFLGVVARLANDSSLVIVVFEDAHWADASTLDLLGFLARNLRAERVLVAATYRPAQGEGRERLRSLTTELRRAGAVEIELPPLPPADIDQLVQSIVGEALPERRMGRLRELAGGNPYYAQELAQASTSDSGVPRAVRDLIAEQLAALDGPALDVLRFVAVAGRRTRPELLWTVVGLPDAAVGAATETLIGAGLLARREGPGDEVLEIRHALVREVAYAEQLEPERARRHHAIARALASYPDLAVGGPIETAIEIAHHWQAAGDALRAFPALIHAAEAAEEAYAFPEADRLYAAALEHFDTVSKSPKREPIGFRPRPQPTDEVAALKRRAAEAASLAGNPERAAQLAQQLVDQAGDPEHADARLLAALGRYRYEANDVSAALAAYEIAARRAGSELLPRVLVGQARALAAAGRGADALAAAREASQAAAATGSSTDRRASLTALASIEIEHGSTEAALRTLEEARREPQTSARLSGIRPRPSRVMDLVTAYTDAADVLRRAGRADEARAAASMATDAAKRFGATSQAARLELAAAAEAFEDGSWDKAIQDASMLIDDGPSSTRAHARLVRARVHVARGVWPLAAADVQAVEETVDVGSGSFVAPFSRAVAELRLWRRELAKASESIDDALRGPELAAERVLRAEILELGVAIAVEQHVEARARRSGDPTASAERARDLAAELSAIAEGSADGHLGALHQTALAHLSRLDAPSPDQWATAAMAWETLKRPHREAMARFRLAEAALEHGSREGASEELRRASDLARGLDAGPLAEEIRRLGTRGRVDLERADRPARASAREDNPFGLSEREVGVLRLIALGRTNRQIGEELFITEKTAAHHVSNILAKLDVATRVEASGIAYRLGYVESA